MTPLRGKNRPKSHSARQGGRRRNPNKAQIQDLLQQDWCQEKVEGRPKFTISKIAERISDAGCPVSENSLKKFRKKLGLASRNIHASEKQAAWENLNCPELEDLPDGHIPGCSIPGFMIKRWRGDVLRMKLSQQKSVGDGELVAIPEADDEIEPISPTDIGILAYGAPSLTLNISESQPLDLLDVQESLCEESEGGGVEEPRESFDNPSECFGDPGATYNNEWLTSFALRSSPLPTTSETIIDAHPSPQMPAPYPSLAGTDEGSVSWIETDTFDEQGSAIAHFDQFHCGSDTSQVMPTDLHIDTAYGAWQPSTLGRNIMSQYSPFFHAAIASIEELCWLHRPDSRQDDFYHRWLQRPDHPHSETQKLLLLSWEAYCQAYNAWRALKGSRKWEFEARLSESFRLFAEACRRPTLRLYSDLLYVWFLDWPTKQREFLKSQAARLATYVEELQDRCYFTTRSPLIALLNAFAHFDEVDTDSSCAIMDRLTWHATNARIEDLDGHYDAKEHLVKIFLARGLYKEAHAACDELLAFSRDNMGPHCDDTYRIMRQEGRIYMAEGRIDEAEAVFLNLKKCSEDNKALYRESAARKEWTFHEDLAEIARRRRDIPLALAHMDSALTFSVERYDDGLNTLRIFNELTRELHDHNRNWEIYQLETRYPSLARLSEVAGPPEQH